MEVYSNNRYSFNPSVYHVGGMFVLHILEKYLLIIHNICCPLSYFSATLSHCAFRYRFYWGCAFLQSCLATLK